jgi:hypothetical protein
MSVPHRGFAVLIFTLLGASNGCVVLRECTSDCVTWMQARSAYRCAACPPDCRHERKHYAHGWKQGYIDVAQGGEGCAPPLPPDRYQSCVYQCSEGQAAIRSWYCGYQDGAHAAFSCGVQQFNYIPSPVCSSPPPQDMGVYESPGEVIESSMEPMPEPQAMHSSVPETTSKMDRLPPLKLVAGAVAAPSNATVKVPQSTGYAADSKRPADVILHKNPLRKLAEKVMQTAQVSQ